MSLVNDMLRDLEARNAPQAEPLARAGLASAPPLRRPLPSVWRLRGLLLATALLIAGAGTYLWSRPAAITTAMALARPAGSPAEASAQADGLVAAVPAMRPPSAGTTAATRVEAVRWQPEDAGGWLQLSLSAAPEVQLLGQDSRHLRFALNHALLTQPLPAIDSALLQSLTFSQEAEQLVFSLHSQQAVRFELNIDASSQQVRIRVQPRPAPPASAEEIAESAVPASGARSATRPAPLEDSSGRLGSAAPQSMVRKPNPSASSQLEGEAPITTAVAREAGALADKGVAPQTQVASSAPLMRKQLAAPVDSEVVLQALQRVQEGQTDAARQLLQRQLQQNEASPLSRELLIKLLIAAGQSEAAAPWLTQGLASAPYDAGLRKLQARLLVEQGKPQAALQLLQPQPPAVAADPEYHEIRATLLQQSGQSEQAAAVYYQLLNSDSANARWWVGLGYALEQAQQRQQAARAYRNSLQVPDIDSNLRRYVNQRMQQLAKGQE